MSTPLCRWPDGLLKVALTLLAIPFVSGSPVEICS